MLTRKRSRNPSGIHERFERAEEIKGSSNRSFGLLCAAVLGIIGAAKSWYKLSSAPWWFGAAAVLLVLALMVPRVLGPFNRIWITLGLLLFKIVSPVALGMLYYLMITPIGLIVRLMGKDTLRLGWQPEAGTYWLDRVPPGPAPESIRNQF